MYGEARHNGLGSANVAIESQVEKETKLGTLNRVILDESSSLRSINRNLERLADNLFGVLEQDPQAEDANKYEKPTLTTLQDSVNEITYWRRRIEEQLDRFKDFV